LPAPDALTRTLGATLAHFSYVDWQAQTSSTNLDLRTRAAQPQALARPWLQGAHWQTQGRGRVGRVWQNRPGDCLMFSCAFDVALAAQDLPMLSPLSGLGACRALRALLPGARQHDIQLKWPNDVLWRGAKLAGILVETTRVREQTIVIMGIGFNLRDAPAISAALERDVADWSQIVQGDAASAAIGVERIVAEIAQAWQTDVAQLPHARDTFPQYYATVDALAGRTVNILDQGVLTLSGAPPPAASPP